MSGNDAIMRYPYGSFLMTRLDLILLRDDELQAQIMRILEYKMVRLREKWQDEIVKAIDKGLPPPPEPEHYWVTLSQGQIIAHLFRFNSAKAPKEKKNTISKGTVRKALNALIEDVYVLTRSQPGKEFQATQYTLNTKLIEEHMWTRLPKEPWSYLGYSGKGEFEAVSPELGGELQILKLGRVTNFETGELQNVNLPLTNLESGELQNLKVLIESLLESRRDTKEDKTTGTVAQPNDNCDAADADRPSHPLDEMDKLVLGLRGNRLSSKTGPLPSIPTTPFSEEKSAVENDNYSQFSPDAVDTVLVGGNAPDPVGDAPPFDEVGGNLPSVAESETTHESPVHPHQRNDSSSNPVRSTVVLSAQTRQDDEATDTSPDNNYRSDVGNGSHYNNPPQHALNGQSSQTLPQPSLSRAKPSVAQHGRQGEAFSQPSLLPPSPSEQASTTTKQDDTRDPIARDTPRNAVPDTGNADVEPEHTEQAAPTSKGKGNSKRQTTGKAAKPEVPEEEIALRKELQTWIDERRGYKLYGRATKEQIFSERDCVVTLAHMLYVGTIEHNMKDGCDWEDLEETWKQTEKDKFWKENLDRIGGYAILQQIAKVIKKRRATAKPATPSSPPMSDLARRNQEKRTRFAEAGK